LNDHEQAATTEVEIFGATYVIRGGHESDHLTRLAAEVDRRMRELAGHQSSEDPGRLAILAALNLADELSRNRSDWDGERGEIDVRMKSLAEELDLLLSGGRSGRKKRRTTKKTESRGTP
jgi:cell division protein ZapA